jgi:hypothetical protein
LCNAFTDDAYLFGGKSTLHNLSDTKLAITASSAGGGVFVFGNYNRNSNAAASLQYEFFRRDSPLNELKTWEV